MASKTERIKAWVSNNVVVTKAVFFILGLVVSQSIVEYMVVCKLMLFLEEKIGPILIVSSIIINAFDGVSSLFPFLLAYIAHAYTNSFNVTVFTTGAYAMGLILLWVTAEFDEHSMFYVALVLIALGKSGRGSTLQSFLQDQLMMKKMKDHNHNHNHTRETPISEQHQNAGITITDEPHTDQVLLHLHLHLPTKIWWHSAWICGYVISLCALGNATHHHSWSKHLEISALLVATAHLVFYSGFFCYAYIYNQDPPRRPFGIADFRELKPDTYKEILLWAAFIGYSLVLATGNTLFIAQTSSTKFVGSKGIINPVSLFFVLKSFICDIVVFLFWCVVEAKKKVVGTTNTITMVRIGGGMICGVLCCVIAREVEIQRLDLIRKEGILSPNDTSSAMGVLWLTPQYCLLGLMEGLAGGGFVTHNQRN
ncbi:protein NRT1/ PTR FAMILY 5.14-like [Senna tora]|uniref:Protein NRT1/ PTR FAMILY 5.14-like n=1 Tax=Senna tora TaxID=362788 RepID=A0A834TP67_9FABA|nr:protein NRT1/ PTR FAMILY 5.14-like [Senna tora]